MSRRHCYDPGVLRIRPTLAALSAAAVVLVTAGGCVTYEARPLHPDETAAALEARRLDSRELRECMGRLAGAPLQAWPPRWDLAALTSAAFCGSSELAGVRAALETARAALVTAGARQEPGLGITAEYQSNAEHGLSPWTVGPTFDVPLTTAGKREIRVARERNLAEAARLDVLTSAWTVRSRVRAALVDLRGAELLAEALRAETAARDAVLRSLAAQRAAGAISAPEVAAARAELEGLRLDLTVAQSGAAVARAALAAVLGVPAAALEGVTIDSALPDPPAALPSGPELGAPLSGRFDVLAALARYEASQDGLRLAIAEQYPDLHLGPGFLWDQGASRWQLGLSLVLPLIERNRGPIGEAEARRAEAAGQVEAAQMAALAAIDAAAAEMASASARLSGAEALTATSRELAEAARRALAAGGSSRLDVLLADAATQRALRVRVEAWRSAQQALGALEDALQRPLAGETLPPSPLPAPAREGVAAP